AHRIKDGVGDREGLACLITVDRDRRTGAQAVDEDEQLAQVRPLVRRAHVGERLALLADAFVLDAGAGFEGERGAVEAAVAKHAVGAGNLDRGPEGRVSPARLAVGDDAVAEAEGGDSVVALRVDRKSTRLNSSHVKISYAVF